MKKSELKQLIREEIQNLIKEEAPKPKFKKGDSFAYRGIRYTVISDNGYVVKVEDKKGKEATYNYNQLKQGMSSPKPDFLKEEKEIDYEVYYMYRERGNDEIETETPINVKASSKEEAIEKAKEKLKADKPSRWRARINSSFEAFEKKKD